MEKLGNILAIWLHGQRSDLRGFYSRLGKLSLDRLSLVLILIFAILPLTLYFIFNAGHYRWEQILAHYLIVILLFVIALVLVIGWSKANAMQRGELRGFTFVGLLPKKVDRDYFGFDGPDMDHLEDLLNHRPVKGKIVIREVPKNKQSGNLRYLFTLLDLMVEGGIRELGTESRESLSELIQGRFSFEGSQINANTFGSSYSKWVQKTRDGDYDDTRKRMSQALGLD